MEKTKKILAHGLTHQDLQELHDKQIHGQVEMIPANNLATLTDKYFLEEYGDYKVKEHNRNIYHIAMEKREFRTVAGHPRKTSHSMVSKFTKEEYRQATSKESKLFEGYTAHILHFPEELVGKQIPPMTPDKGDKMDPDDTTITLEQINELASAKDAKDLYLQVTGEEATKNWTLEKTKEEIINYLGLAEPPKE